MKTILLSLFTLFAVTAVSQTSISGTVISSAGDTLPGVNIYIEGSYDGASSDAHGSFKFTASKTGTQVLKATFIGFKAWEKEIKLDSPIYEHIVLSESINTLDAVTITAGSFAAADESRASIMNPIDIYTTASANGDVMAAMRTMPGTQAATDDGRLLVRGGDAYETQTYMDGLIAAKPYYSKTPDVATRGRFAPSLFNGVAFNSGGYSAEYGQALSSVLVLNTNDLAAEDVTGLSLMSIGGEISKTKRWDNTSLSLSGSYLNFEPYRKIFNSAIDWKKPVEAINGTAIYRHKTKSNGLLKAYVTTDWGDLSYYVPNGANHKMKISSTGTTFYSNVAYKDCLSEKSCYKAGVSGTWQNNKLGLGNDKVDTKEMIIEGRFTVIHDVAEGIKLSWGMNETTNKYSQDYREETDKTYTSDFTDNLLGGFVESEIKFSKNIAIRPGIRVEYSSILNKANIDPRFALAFKTGETSQLSAAFGLYHQTPQADYLKYTSELDFENAIHYVLSYQKGDIATRLFRAETYYKSYNKLVTYSYNDFEQPDQISNNGDGYAGGIDIFWRDKKTIKGFDYWITYSYIDTKRKYKNYPDKATPEFISDHNFSVVGKYWINKISTQVGFAYTTATGRPYNDPNSDSFMGERTGTYSDLSLNFSHIFYIGNQYSVLYMSVNNILGNNNALSYRASSINDSQGHYELTPVKRDLKRMVFVGLFLSF